jgi:hypothetical protein
MAQKLRRSRVALLAAAWLLWPLPGLGQVADFKIAWTTIGEAVSSAEQNAATAQRATKIARVAVQPTVVAVAVDKQVCIASLQLRAFGADGKPIAGAPLTIEVRADHKVQLQVTHLKGICMRPAKSGEYPIRFTSKLPAPDDTVRGAQIYLRVK